MKRFLLPVISILVIIPALFSACDVGLGEAVDTEKPTVSIEYPSNNVVIKEDFVISGKCHDDTSIKSVKVLFQNTSRSEFSFDAVLSEDKNSWSAKINEFDSEKKRYPLADGSYSVTMIATDSAGRTQEDKTSLRIDNTPPLLVLTNPATVLDEKTPLEKAGGFGATIKIQGSVNDFSVTDSDSGSGFVFTVFDKDDNYLGRCELANIPPSLGIIIGEYPEGEGTTELTESNKFYKMIYGDVGEVVDTKYRKFKVTVSDSARTYKGADVVSDASERGNVSEYYYLYDEIYTDVINNLGIGLPDVYKIITKRAENQSELSESEKNILATLEQFKHDSDDEYEDSAASDSRAAVSRAMKVKPVGTFSLNPLNNPSYEITSFDAFDSSAEKPWEGKSVSTSGNITLLAKVGLSDVPLDDSTFKVVVYKTDEYGKRLESTDEDKNEDVVIPCEWTKNGSNYTGRLTLSSKYVEVAQFYTIELKGQDKSGVEFYNGSKEYKFLVQSGTTPPDVKILSYSAPNSGTTVYLKKKDASTAVDLVISGTAESRSGSAKGHVTLYPNVNKNDYRENKVVTKSNTETDWTLTIPGSVFDDQKSDAYTVTIYATDEIANQTSKEISVIFDKEDPKVQVNSVNNVVVFDSDTLIKVDGNEFTAKANRGYVNGTITVAGNVSDNDAFASGTWKAICAGKEIAAGKLATSQFKLEIDTTKGTDGQELSIEVEAFDRAGNKCSYLYKYDDGNPLVIHQITDYPVVKLTNASFDIVNDEDIKVGENLFDQTGNNKLSGSVTDDDGIETINVLYAEVSGSGTAGEFKSLNKNPIKAGGKTSYSLSQELKDSSGNVLAEGSYKIKITATDINGKTFESQEFALCISNSAPAITFTNPLKNTSVYQKKNFVASGTVSGQFKFDDDSSTAILKRGTKSIEVTKNAYGTFSWSDTISYDGDLSGNDTPKADSGIKKAADGVDYTIAYTVTDKFGRSTTDTVQFKTDYTAPIVKVADASNVAYIGKTKTTLYSFSGTVEEANSLKSLEYRIVKLGAGENDDPLVDWTSIPAQKTFNANIDFNDVSEKDVVVQFRATDDAGNVSDINADSIRAVKIIETAPVFEAFKVTAGDKPCSLREGESIYYVKENFTVGGTVKSEALDKISGAGKEWTSSPFDIKDISSAGENSYTFTAVDKAGQSASDSISVFLDKDSPKPEVSQVSPLVTGYEKTPEEYTNGAVNGTITIQGTSSDNDKVVSTVLKIYKVKTDVSNIVAGSEAIQSLSFNGIDSKFGEAITIENGVTSTANNFKFNVDTKKLAEKFDNAGIILRLESTDRAGNTSFTDYPVYVCQETDKPTLSFNNGDVKCTDESKIKVGTNLFGMGSDTLYINVADDDGVKSVEYTLDGKISTSLLSDGKSTTFSAQIDVSTFSAQIDVSNFKDVVHSLRFTVTDVNNLSESFPKDKDSSIKIAYDNDVPEISVSKINDVSYSENIWIPKSSTVNGTVSDGSDIKGVYLSTDSKQEGNLLSNTENNKWSYSSLEDNDGVNYNKSFVAVDRFGRASSVTIKYSIDTVLPEFINSIDSDKEDEKIIIASGSKKANTSELEKKWFNQTAITISGTVKEAHLDTLYLDASGNETSFTASSSGEKPKFKVTSEFIEGSNSFTLNAKDKAGNKSSIGPFSVNIDITPPTINNVSIEGVPESGVVNSNSKLSVKFDVTDKYKSSAGEEKDGSGIAEIIVSDSSSFANKLGNWLLTFDSSVDENVPEKIELSTASLESKTYQLWIRVIDKAGNTSDKEISSFVYDNKAPDVKITSPSNGTVVNKEIELKGTVIETNLDTSSAPVLWMYGNSGWENISDKTDEKDEKYVTTASIDSLGTTWTIKLDTEKISNTATNVEKAFFVQIKDKAGNVNDLPHDDSSAYKLKINQDSDRPVVYITNISLSEITSSNPVWHKQNTITGIVSDDDGSVKELYVSETESSLEKTSSSENLFKNGSWTYKFEENGAKDLYFKVIDLKGTIFISKVESDLNSPKIQDSNSSLFGAYGTDSVVHIKVDTKEPTIPAVRYTTINPSADLEGDKASTNAESILASDFSTWTVKEKGWKDINSISADVFGGDYSKLYMLVKATDENGISSLKGFLKSSIASEASYAGSVGQRNLSSATETTDIRLIEFDISKLTSGTKTLSIVAKDKASEGDDSAVGTAREFSVAIDNSAPEVKFNSHTDGASVYGSESVTIRGETSDSHSIVDLFFALSKSKDEKPNDKDWFSVYDNTSVFLWNILFDGNSNSGDSAHHAKKLNDYINDLYDKVGDKKYADVVDNVPICIWAYAVDEYNNSGKTNPVSLPLTVVTQGDKPTIDITYPENEQTVGGTITITGSTKIATNSVSAVYVQIDPDYNETEGFSNDWKTKLQSVIDSSTVDYEIVETNNEIIGSAVKANGSVQSWNLIINAAKEFNKKDSDGKDANRKLAVRCYALSASGKVSEPSIVSFTLDPGSPVFGSKEPLRLVQYNDDGTEKASQMYESGMWIKGVWYLTGSVEDDSGIKSLKLDGTEILNSEKVEEDVIIGDYKNYILKIPLGSESGYGNISCKLEAFEGSSDNKSTTQEININYDNQAPDFKSTTLSEKETNKIFQSDGVYEIKGSFLEDGAGGNQSGFNRIAFYFTRTLDGKTYIIDSMLQKGTDGKQNRYDVATETGLEKDEDGLYWRKVEDCKVVNGNEISLSELPSNVRVGGLCKVNNIVYRIKTISDKTVTVGSKITNSDSGTAYFAVAQVIDNTIKETGKTTYYGDSEGSGQIINDDGDGMVESYSESSGEWTVSINTHNIFDGPINIHFVAFDKAGNMTTAVYSGIVSNNAPRIAGIILGTDLNGNGKVDNSEFIKSYSGLYNIASSNKMTGVSVNGKKANGENVTSLDVSDDGKAVMTIKGTSKFIPEIVGGNTSLGWSYSVDGIEKHSYTEFAETQHSDSNDVRDSATTTIELTMLDFLKDSVEDGTNQKFKFSIWDKTEGFTAGTDSQHADFNIVMNVAIKDEIPPEVYIKPFYWNSSSENSIFADSDGTLKGHIELEEDWKQTDSYKNSGNPASSGEYDADPKVSGIIYIEGNASDNVVLQKLEMVFPGLNGNSDYITVAERIKGDWVVKGSLETDGFKFEIKGDGELFDNVEGNSLDYRIAVDTSKITTVAATDVSVKMRATDRGSVKLNADGTSIEYGSGNNSVEAQEVTSAEKPTAWYRMDVVPYITGLRTTLSDIEKKNSSVYGRTALGKYPVYYYTKNASGVAESEVIGLNGFNLAEGAYVHLEGVSTTSIPALDGNFDFRLPSNAKSGKFYVTVNEIKNLNNENYTDSKGSYTDSKNADSLYANYKNYYNRQANGVNNDYLNDDLELAIWGINSQSAVSPEGVITEPTMHINPVDGQLGFSFSSGNYGYYPHGVDSQGKAQAKSLEFWCRDYTPVNTMRFIYDNQGHMFGVHAGTDTNNPRVARFRLVSSVWGPSSTLGRDSDWLCAYSANNALRLEYMANYKPSDKSYVMNGTRFQFHPQLAASASGDTTNLYLMYYDSLTNELRFRAGKMNNKTAFALDKNADGNNGNSTQNVNSSFDDFYDDAYTDSRTNTKVVTNYNHVSVLASSATNTGSLPYAPGERYDIAVVPGSPDVVVAVWNDDIRNTLWYSYLEDPIQNNHKNVDSNHVNRSWSTPVAILNGNSGGYAAIAVDSDKHVHIASYSKQNTGSLVYTYLESYDSPVKDSSYVKNHSVFVDSYGATGQYITIDFAKDSTGTRYVPYIGYLMTSLQYPKYAYLVDVESADGNSNDWTPKEGSDSENMYTGAWESVILPTNNKFLLDDICIGVLRDSNGMLKNIPVVTGTDKCGGNGTSNPVLGYGINYAGQGYIETAQLK